MKRFLNWLLRRSEPAAPPPRQPELRRTGAHRAPVTARPKAQPVGNRPAKPADPAPEFGPRLEGRIDDNGPGKNVLIRNRYLREDTGTHDSLKILDDSMVDTEEEAGIDPYNTGQFDRSRNWDRRFRN
ncbi:MAG: hypothetical protein R3176_06500 [Woeseiaceae bacterium]|nr:hypothetical protein [Woeseiaceae bacterium]